MFVVRDQEASSRLPRVLRTQRKVKSKQVKSTQAKGKTRVVVVVSSFSFFQSLKGPVSKASVSNKKNRPFQLLNIGRDE